MALNVLSVLNAHNLNQGYTQAVNPRLRDSMDSARSGPAETRKEKLVNSSVKYSRNEQIARSMYPGLTEMGGQQLVATGY